MKTRKPKKKKVSTPKNDDTLKIIGGFEDVIKKAVEGNPKPPPKRNNFITVLNGHFYK